MAKIKNDKCDMPHCINQKDRDMYFPSGKIINVCNECCNLWQHLNQKMLSEMSEHNQNVAFLKLRKNYIEEDEDVYIVQLSEDKML